MSFTTRASSQVLVLAGLLLAGCAADGSNNLFTTGALGTAETAAAPEPKVDPACVSLVSRIEGLRKEGVADKIEKAAAKKYKMTQRGSRQGRSADQGERRIPAALLDDHAAANVGPVLVDSALDAGGAASGGEEVGAEGSRHQRTGQLRELAPRRTLVGCVALQAWACESRLRTTCATGENLPASLGRGETRTARCASSLVLLQSCHTAIPRRLKSLRHCVS